MWATAPLILSTMWRQNNCCRLEGQPQGRLQLTRCAAGSCGGYDTISRSSESGSRRRKVGCVGEVERFDTSLKFSPLSQIEILEDGSIEMAVMRAIDRVSAGRANRSDCLPLKGGRIEPFGDAVIDVVGIVQLVGSLAATARA